MQAQVSSKIVVETIKVISSVESQSVNKEPQNPIVSTKNYLQLKNQICRDTFHIGC